MKNTQSPEETHLTTLIQAVQIATKRGAFELAETRLIADSVDYFTKPVEKAKDPEKEEITSAAKDK